MSTKNINSEREREERDGQHTVVNTREGAGVAESGPEVEAVEGPKPGEQSEPELVESTSVAHRVFLREPQWAVNGGPHRR